MFHFQIRDATANKKFLMGNVPLTRLWNLCPDNLQVGTKKIKKILHECSFI